MASFTTVWGTRTEINNTPVVDGQLLFETNQDRAYTKLYNDTHIRKEIGSYDWSVLINKPFESTGAGLVVNNGVISTGGLNWSEVINKPFNTLSNSFVVNIDNELTLGNQIWGDVKLKPFRTIGSRLSVNADDEIYVSGQSWNETTDKPFTSLGIGLEINDGVLEATGAIVGGIRWFNINSKPFETIGNTLTVVDGVLSANPSLSNIAWNDIINKPFNAIGNGLTVDNHVLKIDTTVIKSWNDISDKPFTTVGNGLSITGTTLNVNGVTWNNVFDKPFETIGGGLSISSNVIYANIRSVILEPSTWTDSGITYGHEVIRINGSTAAELYGSRYIEKGFTLSSSSDVNVTFSNSVIEAGSEINVYCDVFGLDFKNIVIQSGSCEITFPQYDISTLDTPDRICRIYIK